MRTLRLAAACLLGWCLAPPAFAQAPDVPSRLSLDQALRLVQERTPSLASARGRVAAATGVADGAGRRPNPTFSFSSEGARPFTPEWSPDNQEVVFLFEQELETGGRRGHRSAAATAAVSTARAALDDEWRQLRLETARTYFGLVLARLETENARTTLNEVDQLIAVNRARYQQGEVSGVELRRLEVERMKFSDDVLLAELTERNARASLLSLLGAGRLDAPLEPTDGFGTPSPAPPAGIGDAAALIARALSSRPDVSAARGEQQRAASEFELQRALRLPNVTFGAGYRRDFGQGGLAIALSIPLPLFDRNPGGIARADAERGVADGQLRQTERRASLEVQLALNTLSAMQDRLASIEAGYLQKAREARDSALAAYRSGATDLIDYLDAQRAYRDVQRAHQRAQFDVRVGRLQLDAASGAAPGETRQ